eukprot:scaffold22123_cov64-Phaeocystis_antarctica.AAC.1
MAESRSRQWPHRRVVRWVRLQHMCQPRRPCVRPTILDRAARAASRNASGDRATLPFMLPSPWPLMRVAFDAVYSVALPSVAFPACCTSVLQPGCSPASPGGTSD